MNRDFSELTEGKKIYFASDFHLGAPNDEESRTRESKIIDWLDQIKNDAEAVFLVGDIFDFWFEYKYSIPKGFIRFLGKIAEISDSGIPIIFYTGNHDMWMADYFPMELNVQLERKPKDYLIGNKRFHIGHGDGLGPGDGTYKILKKVFANRTCQWLFQWLHPNVGMGLAKAWSRQSRAHNEESDGSFDAENEWILSYCKEKEKKVHFDYYIFGHRHLPIDYQLSEGSRYVNLGEWITQFNYGVFDGHNFEFKKFKERQ
ncbi:UDP-2,3-diacylglucosamine diphosphatase [Reichenbachiella sp. MALMAid0571]|uniref:UDP-2,3-diacylglucosamine diphosphatase n=1 Tax=Reichenbachiella sp. MALMAid0571 TaxID=3143939 RepID=UPI0032DFA0A4